MRRVAPVAGRALPDRVEMLGGSTTTIVTSTTSSNVLPAADRQIVEREPHLRLQNSWLIAHRSQDAAARARKDSRGAQTDRAAPERGSQRANRRRRVDHRPMPSASFRTDARASDRPIAPPRRPGAPPHGRASPFPGNGDLDHSATHISRRAPVTPPVTPHASASSRRHRRRTPIRPRRPAGPRTASEPCYPVRACCARVACTAL